MKFSIAFSLCPNDTFIFDGLVNNKIDTEGFTFETSLEDIEALNTAALNGGPDICKVSYAALPMLSDKYRLLESGSALGHGVGPLLIVNDKHLKVLPQDIIVALPGENTTAHLLFSYAFPGHINKIYLRYDEIEDFVIKGKGAGVIIHENRFTYHNKGLYLLNDLGEFWEDQTGGKIPLGAIVIKKEVPNSIQHKIGDLIRQSIEYSLSNYPNLSDFVKDHAQEMSEDIMRKHIELYVNEFSLGLGAEGRNAVKKLVEVFNRMYQKEIDSEAFLPV